MFRQDMAVRRVDALVIVSNRVSNVKPKLSVELDSLIVVNLDV